MIYRALYYIFISIACMRETAGRLTFKLVIHDHSTHCKWHGGSPRNSIFQPIHLSGTFTVAPRKTVGNGSLRSLTIPTSPPAFKTRDPACALISSNERDSFSHVFTRSHLKLGIRE
ncbi:hypothetical protein AVEN_38381-1 [Araneus ventricosus]|uniref:Uncharacterized protein n=1 Tax=Araneus ventricosus TaxID=182803 RepID=A0A4Y2RPY4_ARAVE|nr:hypothetical protein AVEN_38381-1 [Araneus ventricosus]